MKDIVNEGKLIDLLNGSDYVPTYEDKDGDWMLVGDVPWEWVSINLHSLFIFVAAIEQIFIYASFGFFFRMFVDSCKRIRIMKGSEAIGLG